jgi:LacI family transcriptional regulator
MEHLRIAVMIGGQTDMSKGIVRFSKTRPNWHLFLFDSHTATDLSRLGKHGAHGVVTQLFSEKDAEQLSTMDVPVVNARQAYGQYDIPRVSVDNAAMGQAAFEYFYSRGFRSFAYIGTTGNQVDDVRREGYHRACLEAGQPCQTYQTDRLWRFDEIDGIMSRLARWLHSLEKPVGLLGFSDQWALAAAQAARQSRIAVPQELAILGIDDNELTCQLAEPPMSSIDPGLERVGYRAAELLGDLLDGKDPPDEPVLLPPGQIIERGSTEILAYQDPDVVRALEYIRAHAADGINVEDVLTRMNVSRSGLGAKFRTQLGRTVHDEIMRIRMDRVRRLLLDTDWQLARIAAECGFQSLSHLTRTVKRLLGMTPTELRRTRR